MVKTDARWAEWDLKSKEADVRNSFDARDAFSTVKETWGPLVVLGQLKSSSVAPLQERLAQRCVIVHKSEISDSTDIYDAFIEALASHDDGKPGVPRKLAVALMLIRKLKRGNYWGGDAKAKAYLSVDELAKGRGVDERYRPIAIEVANNMYLKGLFKKKTGDGNAKYSLNSTRSTELSEILATWKVQDKGLHKYLYGDTSSVPARELDSLLADVVGSEC